MKDLTLNTYMIDVVRPVRVYGETDVELGTTIVSDKVQLVTYAVVAPNPDEAMRRFFEEEAGEIIFEGEKVDNVVVGFERKIN